MEVKICVEFASKANDKINLSLNETKEFNMGEIPSKVECPDNCVRFGTYFVIRSEVVIDGKHYLLETNKMGSTIYDFYEGDPQHLPHSVQVADMLKRVKVPKFVQNGDLHIVHYVGFDREVHADLDDCPEVYPVSSNRLQDIVVPKHANRFEIFDRYVLPIYINGEQQFLFTPEKLNRRNYYIGYLEDEKASIKWFKTVDGRPGLADENDILLDPSCIESNGKIRIEPFGTQL